MEISTTIPDEWYWEFRKQSADNQQTENEQLRELVADFIEVEEELTAQDDLSDRDSEFAQAVRDHFDLEPFSVQSMNVLAVATKMKHGFTWNEAVKDTAEAAKHSRDVDDNYEKTVRGQCTRDLNRSTDEFKQDVEELITRHAE